MRILVTGATHGMGKGVALVLADQGHEVVILGRSKDLCVGLVQELAKRSEADIHSYVLCDLARLTDVRAAIDTIQDRFQVLDGVFVNAGIGYAPARVVTEDGMDAHFQVNYLSQFLLTRRLMPRLERSEHGGRVVFNAANFGALDLDDLQLAKGWGYERAIGQAMVAKRMFVVELRNRAENDLVSFIGFHIAKTVWTNQLSLIPSPMRWMAWAARLFGQFISIERCGAIMAPLFTDNRALTRERSGQLLTWKNGVFEPIPPDEGVLDPEKRQRLWRMSLELCGES